MARSESTIPAGDPREPFSPVIFPQRPLLRGSLESLDGFIDCIYLLVHFYCSYCLEEQGYHTLLGMFARVTGRCACYDSHSHLIVASQGFHTLDILLEYTWL